MRNLVNDQLVTVTSNVSSLRAKVRITEEVPRGVVSIDHGWGSRLFDPRGGSAPTMAGVNRNALVDSQVIDELSGLPNLNSTYVNLTPT